MKITNLFVALMLITLSFATYAQSSKTRKIKELMNQTGSANMVDQMLAQIIAMNQQAYANVPNEFWESFQAEVDSEELVQLLVPIYDKYYSEGEIDQLLEFYSSPVGQKTITVMPSLMQESMTVGQQWGMQLGEKVTQKLQEAGY